eukprot:CAMPEP_0196583550 /NCGR_PEP_ID=MMETSP1081-20130531/43899_1 /TAXON_ID=36882 /ORGANISM="Pyramimonas amylifera, Strain CCMP720" /LENGTH=169 /DNA_ID=CAMNT_0041904475 /DNA_START=247 /DNA_END=756 /DNA_ORIENTATION=+
MPGGPPPHFSMSSGFIPRPMMAEHAQNGGPAGGGFPGGAPNPGRPTSARSGGGAKLCRFGQGCTREDCHFEHPEGKGSGEGKSHGPRPPPSSSSSPAAHFPPQHQQASEDQIRRDTWYPQARECVCCKGFINGCETPACAAKGECACASTPIVPAPLPPQAPLQNQGEE